jgi:KaiC/GvpD/RAD55 family RecA-like ATPase
VTRSHVALTLGLLILLLVAVLPPEVKAGTSSSQRIFYLASSGQGGSLAPISPSPGAPFAKNFTGKPLSFILGTPLIDQMSIFGPLRFSLWVQWTGSSSGPPSIVGSFDYRYPTLQWNNFSAAPAQSLVNGSVYNATFTYDIANTIPLLPGTTIAVSLNVTSIPRNGNVTLYWGSQSRPSFVGLPFSGYMGLPSPVTVADVQGHTTDFPLVPTNPGNNVLQFRALVTSALGFSDIGRVNMTIIDPNSRPVRDRANITMQPPLQSNPSSPFTYLGYWTYPSNSTVGTYQVWIDVLDVQGLVAYSLRGPVSFTIVPPGYIPFPYLALSLAGGGGGIVSVAGVLYYRGKKRKSYLAPFDHFSTLTSGELNDGTVAIEGNTGSGKSILSEQLMFEDLKKGRPCIFVATSDFPSNVRAGMKSMGLDTKGYEQNGLLTFVDGYSAEAGQESLEKFSVPSVGDLTTLGMKISSSLPSQPKGASLYFDSLVPLASKTKPESIVSFVQSIGAKMRGIGGKAVFTLGPSVDPMVQKQLEDMSDCVVQMEAFEEGGIRRRRLKIAKLRARRHQEGWNVFAIEDGKGIIFYSKKPKT